MTKTNSDDVCLEILTMNKTLTVQMRDIDTIQPYDRNPRRNDDAVNAVARSIQQFGFRQPIVIDADGVIIVGHTRWKAAKQLGLAKVPVHLATDLTAEQIKAYRIADNKTAELADWDFDLLPVELAELKDAGFDLAGLAFDQQELAKLLKPEPTSGLIDDDAVPETSPEPISRAGDLWLLGAYTTCPHCGGRNDVQA